MMDGVCYTANDLKTYLRQRRTSRTHVLVPEFENFLKDVSDLFALRMAAEEHWTGSPKGSVFSFREHRHEATSLRGALPLEWPSIMSILVPVEDAPRTTLIGFIAAHCAEDVRAVSLGLRRILSRERVGTPVGKVQQLDTYCMRWLMRQPGRSFEEKAGTRQRVMAVVRREQFDTLENRVFKDFLIRSEILSDSYIEEIRDKFAGHKVFDTVRRFKLACQSALTLPEMDSISSISYLPQPNYVLQQDNHYSKIWAAYCRIVRLSNLAEKLWRGREELKRRVGALRDESMWQHENGQCIRAHTQIWIRPLDGDAVFTERGCRNHALANVGMVCRRRQRKLFNTCEGGIGVVDVTGAHAWGEALSIGGIHENAKPRIADDTYPLFDDTRQVCQHLKIPVKLAARQVPLGSIFPVVNDDKLQDSRTQTFIEAKTNVESYCARLIGEMRDRCSDGMSLREIVVLSPDDWNPVTQEIVIRAFPSLERRNVHLLWRSVAMAVGLDYVIQSEIAEGESVAVVDFRNDGSALVTNLKYLKDDTTGRLVPQRSVYASSGGVKASRYAFFKEARGADILGAEASRSARVVCLSGSVPTWFSVVLAKYPTVPRGAEEPNVIKRINRTVHGSQLIVEDGDDYWSQKRGAVVFCQEHMKRTVYFDELEAMWIVGQRNENIIPHPLVEGDNRFPGGKSKSVPISDGLLQILAGSKGVKFLFHIGELTCNTPLHSYAEDFLYTVVYRNTALEGNIEVSPGQGIAVTTVNAPVFKEPIVLDYLRGMTLCGDTIRKLEEQLPRSFPPTSATVEAYENTFNYSLFRFAQEDDTGRIIRQYLTNQIPIGKIDNGLFAKAQRLTDNDLKPGESRLRLLDRRNVFGNMPTHLRPSWMSEKEEERLLDRLVHDEKRRPDVAIRLLAWTYRGSHKGVGAIAERLVEKYKCRQSEPQGLLPEECSFLANTLADKTLRKLEVDVFKVFSMRCMRGYANANDYRLIYNILQFDANVFQKIKFSEEWMIGIFRMLKNAIAEYREGGNSNCYQFSLRCVLYFLRYREHHADFLRSDEQYKERFFRSDANTTQMGELYVGYLRELEMKLRRESVPVGVIRKATKKFISGLGTLDDVIGLGE